MADSGSGADIIHPRVLTLLPPTLTPTQRSCNVLVVTANHDRIHISDFVTLSFSLPLVNQTRVFTRDFLIMPTPYDVVLSFDTLRSTGLGHIIFQHFPPTIESFHDVLLLKRHPSQFQLPTSIPDESPTFHCLLADFRYPTNYDSTFDVSIPSSASHSPTNILLADIDPTTSTLPDTFADTPVEFDPSYFPDSFASLFSSIISYDPPTIAAPPGHFHDSIAQLVNQYSQTVFRGSLPPTPAKLPPFDIEFADVAPHLGYRPPRRLSPSLSQALTKSVDDLLDQHIIHPSTSSFASPIVMAVQKDKIRMCIDYRELNSATKRLRYPLPNTASIFPNLAGNTIYASLDLRSGYHQLSLTPHASQWSAFVTPFGQYSFNRVPFGLANAPAWFQRCMTEIVLAGYVGIICYVFIDDIIIFAKSEAEFLVRLTTILDRLQHFNVVLKGSKCHLGTPTVRFLGFIADSTGILHDPDRCQQFLLLPQPTTKKSLRSFLGLGNFFRDFIRNYAELSKPLSSLLSGPSLQLDWTPTASSAFSALKSAVGATVKNFYLDYAYPIYLHTDASNLGIGAILFQIVETQFRPIHFVSKSLTFAESRWMIQELESYAIVYSVTKLDHYLRGSHFIIHTDHKNLVYIKRSSSAKITRWHLLLMEYDFDLSVVTGKDNLIADVLSRAYPDNPSTFTVPPLPTLNSTEYTDYCALNARYSHPSPQFAHLSPTSSTTTHSTIPLLITTRSQHASASTDSDTPVVPLHPPTTQPTISSNDLDLVANYHNDTFGHHDIPTTLNMLDAAHPSHRLRDAVFQFISSCPSCQSSTTRSSTPSCVNASTLSHPPTTDQTSIIAKFHNFIYGHHGINATLQQLRINGHTWDHQRVHVTHFIQTCPHCQKNKYRRSIPTPEFTTTETYEPFVMLAIDTFGPLPTSPHGYKYVFAIVCCFTTFVELVPSFDNTAVSAANALLTVFGRYGIPYYLRSDNAPNFTSNIIAALRSILDISADFTIPYRPQSNGIVERRIGTVMNHLRALIYADIDVTSTWSNLLPIVQRICNATYVSSIGCSPSELIFGSGLHLNRGLTTSFTFSTCPPSPLPYINSLLNSQASLIRASQLFLAQQRDYAAASERITNSSATDFPPNSYVLVTYPTEFRPKLANQLRGPFRVVSSLHSTYLLQSLTDNSITFSIHLSRLRPFLSDESLSHLSPLEVAATDDQESVIDFISSHRGTPTSPDSMTFLIHWLNEDDSEATWQSYDSVANTIALDLYIILSIPTHPDFFLLIPPTQRTLISVDRSDHPPTYLFTFHDSQLVIPTSTINKCRDRAAIRNLASTV